MVDNQQGKYHTVSIRSDLPEISKRYEEEELQQLPPNNFWVDKVARSNADSSGQNISSMARQGMNQKKYTLQYTVANEPYTHNGGNHAILKAFLHAYNSHEDVILSPDDTWLMVCIGFAQYVNDNSKQTRHLFVDHQDKQRLTVVDNRSEPDWEDFLEKMRLKIGDHVKNDVSNLLTSNFSTTTKVESLLSSLAIMATFKNYFDYEYIMDMCGIRNIHFLGTLDDWKLLRQKTEQLKAFTLPRQHDTFATYITGLLPILDQCIETYQGKVNNLFWDTIFDLKHQGGGSGRSRTYINGWFLRLCYGNHEQRSCHIEDIELNTLIVPINVTNVFKNESKTCYIAGGFHGVKSYNGMHKPVMSLAVIDDVTTIKKLSI